MLAALLAVCAFTLCIAGIVSAKAKGINMEPVWGFDKAAAAAAGADGTDISRFAHSRCV